MLCDYGRVTFVMNLPWRPNVLKYVNVLSYNKALYQCYSNNNNRSSNSSNIVTINQHFLKSRTMLSALHMLSNLILVSIQEGVFLVLLERKLEYVGKSEAQFHSSSAWLFLPCHYFTLLILRDSQHHEFYLIQTF